MFQLLKDGTFSIVIFVRLISIAIKVLWMSHFFQTIDYGRCICD